MQKFLRILMLAALFLPFALQAQTDVSIGDGGTTNNQYLPGYNYYNYSFTQQIYTATEIGMAGTISSIAFKNTGAEKTRNYNIYMALTSKQTFDGGSDWVAMSANDLVYTGTLTFTVGDWTTIDLDVPFTYDGTSNLIVSVADITGSYSTSPHMSCLVFNATSQAIYAYRDASAYDISDPGVSGTLASVKNQIILSILPSGSQTCAKPATLAASGITANEATLTWASTPAGSYQFEYKADADAVWNEITLTDNTYTLTNLLPNTNYNARVKAICGTNLESSYKTANFTTDCDAITLPYTETFETTSNALTCWTTSGNGNWTIGTGDYSTSTGAYEGSQNAKITHGTSGDATKLISPILDGATDGLMLNFAYVMRSWAGDIDELRIYSRTDANSAWQQVAEYTNAAETWTLESVTIPGAVYQIAFEFTDNYGYGLGIDNVTFIPMTPDFCYPVTNLTASGVTAHEATLTWSGDANSYTIYNLADSTVVTTVNDTTYTLSGLTSDSQHNYGVVANCTSSSSNMVAVSFHTLISCPAPTGLSVTNITIDGATLNWEGDAASYNVYEITTTGNNFITNVTDTTYDLTNLTATTAYTYGVTAVCNDEESSVATISFATACTAITIPFTEDFEANSATLGCWSVDNIASNTGLTNSGAYSGSYAFRFAYNTNPPQYLFSPELNGTENGLQVSFMYKIQSTSYPESFQLGYSTTTNNVADFIWGTEQTNLLNTTYEDYSEILPAGVKYVCIKYTANDKYFLYIDSVVFSPISAGFCFPAAELTANNITANSATLTWNGDANSYTIYDLTDTSFVANVTDLTYSFTGLTSETEYSYGIVANCGSDQSSMVSVTFTTLISCPVPTGITATLNPNDPTEATLNWIENGTANQWQICINGDENNLIDAYDTTYTLTNLTPNTLYTAKVRAYCSADDQSAWSNTISFEPSTKLVIGSGNATNSYLPTYCLYNYSLTQQIYTTAELGDAGLIESIDFYNNSDSRTRDLSVYVVSTPKDTFESATDWISVTAADLQYSGSITFASQAWTTIPLSGFAYDGLSNIAIIVDDNTGSWQSSMSFRVFDAPSQALRVYSDGTNYEVASPAYNGTVMNVKNQIRIAKGSLDGCLKPTGVNVAYTGGDEAVVTWNSDAAAFNISVNGTETNNVTSPYTLTGLSLATTYTVSVQAVCDPTSSSDWTNPISFTTDACMPENMCSISIVGTDSYGDGWNNNAINVIQNNVIIGRFTFSAGYNYTETYNVCSGIPVSFSWETGSYASETSFIIRDGGNAPVYTCANGSSLNDSVFFTLNEACPSCLPVSALYIDAVTENTITISWVGNAASYDVYNGENLEANVTTTSYTFTGLTAATSYTLGVIANCSASEQSSMITVTTSTECPDITSLPYDESFEDGLGCWNTVNGSSDGQPWTVNNCAGITGVNPHSGSYVASSWSWSSSAMHANAWLISPKFILPNTTEGLTLTWWEITNSGYPDSYSVVLSTTTNDTAAFTTVIYPYTQAAGDWTQKYVDLSAYAGQNIYIAFHHVDYDANYLLIDDVNMSVGGYVPPTPDTLTVTFAVNDATMGTTTPVPGTYQYITGDTVTFSATPNAGYHFVGWEWIIDNEVDTLGANYISAIFPVSTFINYGISSMSFTALFEADSTTTDSLTIYLSINDPTLGNITPAPGTYVLPLNDSLVLSATPNAGANFEGWRLIIAGQTVGTLPANPATFPVTAQAISFGQVSIVAIFSDSTSVPDSMTVVINTADATMGTTNPAPGTYNYAVGSQSILAAIPNEGYHNLYWIESITISGMTVSDTLYADTLSVTVSQMMAGVVLHITAYFEANQPGDFYNVSVTSANTSMGTVSSTASGSVAEGTEVTATATPLDGYRFVNWTNDAGVVVSTANPYTFTVTSDVTLIANFELIDGINDIDASSILIYTANSTINVRGAEGQDIYVYDMNGRCIYQQANANDTESISMSAAGIYVVRVSNVLYKKVVIVK